MAGDHYRLLLVEVCDLKNMQRATTVKEWKDNFQLFSQFFREKGSKDSLKTNRAEKNTYPWCTYQRSSPGGGGEPQGHTRTWRGIRQLCSIILSPGWEDWIVLALSGSPGEDPRDLYLSTNMYNIKRFKMYSRKGILDLHHQETRIFSPFPFHDLQGTLNLIMCRKQVE